MKKVFLQLSNANFNNSIDVIIFETNDPNIIHGNERAISGVLGAEHMSDSNIFNKITAEWLHH
jgi:hypothetical protein